MQSSFEKDMFRKIFLLVSAIFLVITFTLLALIGISASKATIILLIIIAITELFSVILLYILSMKFLGNAYESVDKAAEVMNEITLNNGEDLDRIIGPELKEGSIGLLYDSFEKLVEMFRESRRREQLEKEYLKDVMSDISHQLKTPLASMDIFLDLLINDKVADSDEQKKILNEAENQVSRMEWMVLSMLKLARIEAGAVTFDVKETNLENVLDEVSAGVKYLTHTRGQNLKIDCPKDITVNADPEWLVEALLNIVKNASDYSNSDNKDIEIKVDHNKIFTRINITDHGMGMTEETMTHIFDRFYRAGNEVNPNSVGIGLSLSKSIIEGMGGKLTVDSKLGEGSTFKVQF